jgi:membrane-associated phospholipid phosphatase
VSTTPAAPDEAHHGLEHLLLDNHPRAVRVALGLLVVALSLFVAMAIPPLRDAIDAMDEAIYDATYPIKWSPLTVLAHTMDFLGSAWFTIPLRIVIAGYLWATKRMTALAVWLLAIALSEPFVGLLKALYDRPRPPEAIVETITASFPSGHSVAGAVVAISLVVAFVPAGPARRNLEIAAAGFALVMGGSRIYLGAHWFTDVVAGVAFGAAATLAATAIVHRTMTRRAPSRDG